MYDVALSFAGEDRALAPGVSDSRSSRQSIVPVMAWLRQQRDRDAKRSEQ